MFLQIGDHARALELLLSAAALEPSSPAVWTNLGVVMSRTGRFDEAEQALRLSLRLRRSPETLASYAALLLRINDSARLDEALRLSDEAVSRSPQSISGLVNKMTALNRLGRSSEAVSVGERARRIDPKNAYVWAELGLSYLLVGRRSKAQDCAKRSLRIDPALEPAKSLLKRLNGEKP